MGKMRGAGVTTGKMRGKVLGTTRSLPTCSVTGIRQSHHGPWREDTAWIASLRLIDCCQQHLNLLHAAHSTVVKNVQTIAMLCVW